MDTFEVLLAPNGKFLKFKSHLAMVDLRSVLLPSKNKPIPKKVNRKSKPPKDLENLLVLADKSSDSDSRSLLLITSIAECKLVIAEHLKKDSSKPFMVQVVMLEVSKGMFQAELDGDGYKMDNKLSVILGALDPRVNMFSKEMLVVSRRVLVSQKHLLERIWNERNEFMHQQLPPWKLALVLKSAPPLIMDALNTVLKQMESICSSDELHNFSKDMALRFIHNSAEDCGFILDRLNQDADYSLWRFSDFLLDNSLRGMSWSMQNQGRSLTDLLVGLLAEHSWLMKWFDKPLNPKKYHLSELNLPSNFKPAVTEDGINHCLCLESSYQTLLIANLPLLPSRRHTLNKGNEIHAIVVPVSDIVYNLYSSMSRSVQEDAKFQCAIQLFQFHLSKEANAKSLIINIRKLLYGSIDLWEQRRNYTLPDNWECLLILSFAPDGLFAKLCTLMEKVKDHDRILSIGCLIAKASQSFEEQRILNAMDYVIPDRNGIKAILDYFIDRPSIATRAVSPGSSGRSGSYETDDDFQEIFAERHVPSTSASVRPLAHCAVISNSLCGPSSESANEIKIEQEGEYTYDRHSVRIQISNLNDVEQDDAVSEFGNGWLLPNDYLDLLNEPSPGDEAPEDVVKFEDQTANPPRVVDRGHHVRPIETAVCLNLAKRIKNDIMNGSSLAAYGSASELENIAVTGTHLIDQPMSTVSVDAIKTEQVNIIIPENVEKDILDTMVDYPGRCLLITQGMSTDAQSTEKSPVHMKTVQIAVRTSSIGEVPLSVFSLGQTPLPLVPGTTYEVDVFEVYMLALSNIKGSSRLMHVVRYQEDSELKGIFHFVCNELTGNVIATNCPSSL